MLKTQISATSYKNGMTFYSTALFGGVLKAYYDENDQIQFENRLTAPFVNPWGEDGYQISNQAKERFKRNKIISLIILTVLGIILWIYTEIPYALIIFSYFYGVAMPKILLLYQVIKEIRIKDSKGSSAAKFHSAEHRVTHFYEKYGKIPTLEELRNTTHFSKECGSLKIIRPIFFGTMLSIAMFLIAVNIFVFFGVCVAILLLWWLDENFCFTRFFEFLLLSKPSDRELILAIEGLKEFEKLEEALKKERSEQFDSLIRIIFEDDSNFKFSVQIVDISDGEEIIESQAEESDE